MSAVQARPCAPARGASEWARGAGKAKLPDGQAAITPYIEVVRLIALLLAIVMMTGAAAQVAGASPDVTGVVAGAIDDAPGLDPPIVPEAVAVAMPVPDTEAPVVIEAPPSIASGRMHAVLVFRPPRRLASR